MNIKKSIYSLVSARTSLRQQKKIQDEDSLMNLIRSATDLASLSIHNNELIIILDFLNDLDTSEKAYDACLKIGSETPIIKPPLMEDSKSTVKQMVVSRHKKKSQKSNKINKKNEDPSSGNF